MSVIDVSNLCKSFQGPAGIQHVLSGVDLQLQAGEVVMLLGPSGSGKSSLLNLLAGIEPPDSGAIRILDQTLTDMDEAASTRFRRQHIGVVYQFFNLLPTLTVLENVLLPLSLNKRMDEQPRALEHLSALGLSDKCHSFPDQLSGGEQQRVAICRALVHRPAVLLADEPTGSLDSDTAAAVQTLMLNEVRRAGMTLLMVTHSEALTAGADRVLRLHRGQLEQVA